jgi:hypothetical protein
MKNARVSGMLTSMPYVISIFLQREHKQRFWKIVEVVLETNLGIDLSEVVTMADLEKCCNGMYVVCRGE